MSAAITMLAAVTVSTPAALSSAIASAKAGDEIILAPGDYGTVRFNNAAFRSPVTVRSADPAQHVPGLAWL